MPSHVQDRAADRWLEVLDPATGRLVDRVRDHDAEGGSAAVDAAHTAFEPWGRLPPRRRSEILARVHTAVLDERLCLTELICRENGKSRKDAESEVTYAAEFFRWYSEECVRSDGDFSEAPEGGARNLVTRRPVGVAALITPWNFPAAMPARKIAPALAAGCTVVVKPAPETPLTACALGQLMERVGVPEGVVNIVTTSDAPAVVGAWLADDRVRKISFTGSTGTGRLLLRGASERVINASMELGGNAPFIVTDDADVDAAVHGAMTAKFRNGGQACTAANRFYVHVSVAEEFIEKFGAQIADLTVGPAASGAQIGPLISDRAAHEVNELIRSTVDAGARIAASSPAPDRHRDGYFVAPTLLADVPTDAPIFGHEIFGPVAPIATWTDDHEVVRLANASEYGLSAYVYCRDLQRALRLGERLEAGMVGINRGMVSDPSAPFGGVKHSGLGREGAREGLREFTELQHTSIDWPS